MNLNGDEKRIRQLFVEMNSNDLSRAPQFAEVLAAANSKDASSQVRPRSLRFAMAAAILCAVLLIAMAIIVRPSKSQLGETPNNQAAAPTVPPEAPPTVDPPRRHLVARDGEPRRPAVKRVRHRRTPDQTTIAMKSLFGWRSPTASLLETPVDELMRSLPRLGESLQTIKMYSPDQFN
jgi:hypothetical protein